MPTEQGEIMRVATILCKNPISITKLLKKLVRNQIGHRQDITSTHHAYNNE